MTEFLFRVVLSGLLAGLIVSTAALWLFLAMTSPVGFTVLVLFATLWVGLFSTIRVKKKTNR